MLHEYSQVWLEWEYKQWLGSSQVSVGGTLELGDLGQVSQAFGTFQRPLIKPPPSPNAPSNSVEVSYLADTAYLAASHLFPAYNMELTAKRCPDSWLNIMSERKNCT